MLTHAFIIPLIMAISFLAILAFGKKLPRGGAEIGIAALATCFVLAIACGVGWVQRTNDPPEVPHTEEAVGCGDEAAAEGEGAEHEDEAAGEEETPGAAADEAEGEGGEHAPEGEGTEGEAAEGEEAAEEEEHHAVPPVIRCATWFQTGGEDITIGTLVDGASVMMLLVVTFISLLVHVYSSDYVAGDRRFTHYFAFLSLFTASMLMFVLTENTLQLIVGWELAGLCSFVLIGHWWEEKPNSDAALKAFLTNRVGDVGLLVGVTILFFAAGGTSTSQRSTRWRTRGRSATRLSSSRPVASSRPSCRSRASSSSTRGCPTPWLAPPRSRP
jgi:NADH-quinone oxidoreductase subunit L